MSSAKAFTNALWADGPDPGAREALQLFGQFVGEWDFDWIGYNPDGTALTVPGEWIFAWALQGRAIQDVWICPSRAERHKPGRPAGEYGTTLRFYDPALDAWRITWIGPAFHRVRTLIGRQVGADIVLEDSDTADGITQWIFSEITAQSFHWRSVTSVDQGRTWHLNEAMAVRRRAQHE